MKAINLLASATLVVFAASSFAADNKNTSTTQKTNTQTTTTTGTAAGTTSTTQGETGTTGTAGMAGTTGTAGTAMTTMTDAEIAHIMVTANTIDIENGKMAQKMGASKEVKDYGKMMVNDHSSANKQATEITKKAKMQPKENDMSKSMQSMAADTKKKLQGLKGKEFDKAYIDSEVAFHQQVLDTINTNLEPNAKNDQLKDLISKVKPSIEAHLNHAKELQSKFGSM